jgi:Integrase
MEVPEGLGLEFLSTLISTRQGLETLYERLELRQSPGTLRNTWGTLQTFAQYCVAKGWPAPPLVPSDRPQRNPQKPIVVYTDDDLDKLRTHAQVVGGVRWLLFLETLICTGRRVGEVLGLEYAWLNTSASPPHFHLPHTKNGRQAYVPLSTHLLGLWTAEHIATMQTEHNGRFHRDPMTAPFPWSYSCAHKMFQHYCVKVGVNPRGYHNLRHTRATEMLARGVPIQAVSALLGHSSVATTDLLYNHTDALSYARYIN